MTDLTARLGYSRFIAPMRAIHIERQTGVFEIEGPNLRKRLYFVDGELHLRRADTPLMREISAHLGSTLPSGDSSETSSAAASGSSEEALVDSPTDLEALARMIKQHWTQWDATSFRFIPRLDAPVTDLVGPLPTARLLSVVNGAEKIYYRGSLQDTAAERGAIDGRGRRDDAGPLEAQTRLIWQEHFRLSGDPFSLTPDPAFLFLSEGHSEALAALEVGLIERRGLAVLIGEVGTGKTTLLYSLLSEVESEVETAFIANTTLSFDEILQSTLRDLGADVVAGRRIDLLESLNGFLLACNERNQTVAIVVDEAQALSDEAFEGLRQLLNFETYDRKLLQILLVGQPELGARLAQRGLRQVADRIAVRCHLQPLEPDEAKRYIGHRLEAAGALTQIFSRRAIDLVIRESRRIPRSINVLCHNAMLSAFAKNQTTVSRSEVKEAVRERRGAGPKAVSPVWRLGAPILAGSILLFAVAWGWLRLVGGPGQPDAGPGPALPSPAASADGPIVQPAPEPTREPPPVDPAEEPSAEQAAPVRWTTVNLNLRQGPSLEHAIVKTLPLGTEVTVLAHEGDWAIVRSEDLSGWVKTSYLAEASQRESGRNS